MARRCERPHPSNRYTMPMVPPHTSLAALRAMASKTGWRSVGELLITRKISAVAVCCSRDSFSARCRSAYDGAERATLVGALSRTRTRDRISRAWSIVLLAPGTLHATPPASLTGSRVDTADNSARGVRLTSNPSVESVEPERAEARGSYPLLTAHDFELLVGRGADHSQACPSQRRPCPRRRPSPLSSL